MAQKNRTKEIWLIPKRVNLHQTICLIDGIIERKYDGTSWNPQKQNNLGVNLKKWGATKDGKNISPQAIRTLVASIPQYLGFLYVNTESTPNTICLTEAGMALWHRHKDELVKVPNLVEGKDLLITESEAVLKQMEKLQITNPVINKDCENIYVFPFRFMLRVLLKVGYLDQDEIAYFLFKVRNEDEVDVIIAAAGKAAHLPGVIAANTLIPVVGLPIKSSTMDGLDSLLSMVQMPSGIPVATVTIDSGLNAVLMAMQIMSVKYPKLKEDLRNYRQEMAQKVLKDDECLRG